MATDSKKIDKKATKGPTPEEILAGFNQLRNEQRNLATKLSEFEFEVNEHNMVIETLKNVDPARKCHRLIGDVLVEKQVKDVLPEVTTNKVNIEGMILTLREALAKKGQDLNDYKEKHSIRIRGQDDLKTATEAESTKEETRGNVLVS